MPVKDMKEDPQRNASPPAEPPPYPGPPIGPNYPGSPDQSYPGPPQTNYPGYPVTNQPHVTVVHPQNTALMQGTRVYPAVVITNNMSPAPAPYVCPSCNQQIITRVEKTPSMRTHLFAAILCLLGCWPCICVPYCIDSCNNTDHYCTNCNAYIGSYVG